MVRSFSWWARTLFTFSFGFCLGLVLHIFVIFTIDMNKNHKVQVNEVELHKVLGYYSWEASKDEGASPDGPRVLCYILTGPTTHKASLHVKNTWGQRCDKTIFFSTQPHPDLQPQLLDVPEGYMYLWAKTKTALTYLHQYHSSYDWFLKADDDTYVIVENLRYFLKDKNPSEPIYYGVKFKQHVQQGFMSGGGGYVMSRESIKRFVTDALNITDQDRCPSNSNKGPEDVNLGRCMEAVGVVAGDSRDDGGKPRFFSHNPMSLFYKAPIVNKFHWYWRYLWYSHAVGPDCCSQHVISFHDIDARMMWTLEALLYRTLIHRNLRPFIVNTSTSENSLSDASSTSSLYSSSAPFKSSHILSPHIASSSASPSQFSQSLSPPSSTGNTSSP